MGCGACLQGFGTVEAARRSEMMSAVAARTGLPGTSLRVGGEILPGTKSRVNPLESELILRVLRGQHEAFRELVRPCERAVFMATQAILKNEADAEDAAQEAILKAFTNLAKFRGDSKFSTWLVRIATNEALMKLRKERRQKLHDSLDDGRKDEKGNYVPRDFADWREIPSEALQTEELRQALSRALASLTPKHREVLVLERCATLHNRRNRQGARHREKRGENTPPACPPSDARRPCTGYGRELGHRPEGIQAGETMVMEISCEEVWREVSNYLDDEITPELRARMREHFKGCKHCTAVLDGTRNVVQLVGDAKAFLLPAGFSDRLYQKLDRKLSEDGRL